MGADSYRSRRLYSPIVQLVERWTVNPYVAGSSPARGAIQGFEEAQKEPVSLVFAGFFIAIMFVVVLYCPIGTPTKRGLIGGLFEGWGFTRKKNPHIGVVIWRYQMRR